MDTCVFAYNTAKQESTLYSPFEPMFGRKAVIPIDINYEKKTGEDILKEYTESSKDVSVYNIIYCHSELSAHQRQKEQFNRKHCQQHLKFGDA